LPPGRSCGGECLSDRSNRRTMVGDFGSFGLHAHGGRRARYVKLRALSRDPHVSLAQYTIPDGWTLAWRVSRTRSTSVGRIAPVERTIVLMGYQAELPALIKAHGAKEALILREDKDFCLRRRGRLPIRRLNAYIVEPPVVWRYVVLRFLGYGLARLQV
jgi:hypothetical protein